MNFSDSGIVSGIVWQMRRADYMRGVNRAAIDRLFNGLPPLTEPEREAQQAYSNVNKLTGPKIAADARRTYYDAFFKTRNYFTVAFDHCKSQKKTEWEQIITKEINRPLKSSLKYFELLRSQFAVTVLHGIGGAFWGDRERWCPRSISPGDIMIPSGTLLTMDNMPLFAVWRQFTPYELRKLAKSDTPDPGWNQPVVDAALKWCEKQIEQGNMTSVLPARDLYAPERMQEWIKENTGLYAADIVPSIDAWEFYYQCDESGWKRNIVIDTPADFASADGKATLPETNQIGQKLKDAGFLYESKDVYARGWQEVMHFQFGDASSVGPFRYHTVRSLGWLLYSVAHLENRLFNKRMDATFESLMQYFRVANPDDKERVTKIDLHHLGVIPEGLNFVTPQERWQVNHTLVGESSAEIRQSMVETAAQFREGRESAPSVEKTATQVMAEVNSANAIVGSMLLQAYRYARAQYEEICRRFCIPNSSDPEVRDFRARVLRAGVPEEYLDVARWEVDPEQVMGSGNKLLQIAMADKLMAVRPLLDPPQQREVLHDYALANSDDPAKADRLVPQIQQPSNAAHEADQSLASLFLGVQVRPAPGENQIEVIESWLAGIAQRIRLVQATPPVDMESVAGIGNAINATGQRIQMLAQDPAMADRVKQYSKALEDLNRVVAPMAQEAQQAQPQQPQVDPQQAAKAQSTVMSAQLKAQIKQEDHAQKFAQKQVSFAQDMEIQRKKAELDLQKQATQIQADVLEQGIRAGHQAEMDRQTA